MQLKYQWFTNACGLRNKLKFIESDMENKLTHCNTKKEKKFMKMNQVQNPSLTIYILYIY